MGYKGGYDTVRRYIKPLHEEALREATVRFETPPGKQSQVDWSQSWIQLGERSRKIHLFALTLGYSRRLFAQGTSDEKLATFLECHLKAFDHFGGLIHEILYDNTRLLWRGILKVKGFARVRFSGILVDIMVFSLKFIAPIGPRLRAKWSQE